MDACSNNMPLDTMGLYREVVARGGLAANERYDSYGRWTGTINFAGQVGLICPHEGLIQCRKKGEGGGGGGLV